MTICHKNMIYAGYYLTNLISVSKALSAPCTNRDLLIDELRRLSCSLKTVVQCLPFREGLSIPLLPNPAGLNLPARLDLERLDLNLFFLFMGALMGQNEQLLIPQNIPAEALANWNSLELEAMRSAYRQHSSQSW